MAFKIRKQQDAELALSRRIKRHIRMLSAQDLRNIDIDSLKDQLKLLFTGYKISTPFLPIGQDLYRGVKWTEKPKYLRQVSYPPTDCVRTYQRANRPGQPMFYSSIARSGAIFELRPIPGEHIAVSRWQVHKSILVNNVGYTGSVFERLGSNRTEPFINWGQQDSFSECNRLVATFLANQFTRLVSPGNEHEYKLCAAIAEKHYAENLQTDEQFAVEHGSGVKLGGLIYPTISMRANADNVTLLPEFADTCLRPNYVEWIKVDAEGQDFTYQVTVLDFANSFGPTGEIEWKGRRPQWTIHPGQLCHVTVENGRYVMRDELGNIVEPS